MGIRSLDSDTVDSEKALARAYVALSAGIFNVRNYGAKGDGVTDDTAAIQAALDDATTVAASGLSTRFQRKPTVHFPAGVYRITAGFTPITVRGTRITGGGSVNTAIMFDSTSDDVILDFGTFTSTPSNVFAGDSAQNAEIDGVRIQCKIPGAQGSRFGQGIRNSASGSLMLNDVAVLGFKYGINSPYGGDFNRYNDVTVEYCDCGVYQGPGGQQFLTSNMLIFACYDGLVLDRWGHAHHVMPSFINCERSAIRLEAVTDTSTRQLASFGLSGTTYQSKLTIDTPWFESNAGPMGDLYVTTNFIENSNGGSDAYRDIVINNAYIVAGTGAGKTPTAFFANTSGLAAQRVTINAPVFQGTMTRWLTAPHGTTRLISRRAANGYTDPALSDTTGYNVEDYGQSSITRTSGTFPFQSTYLRGDNAHGIRESYDVNGVMSYAFWNGSAWFTRAGFDIQNRRLYLDDPSAAASISLSRAAAMPTSGTYGIGSFVFNTAPSVVGGKTLIGWQRLTTGSGHVAGTDWTPVYGTNT